LLNETMAAFDGVSNSKLMDYKSDALPTVPHRLSMSMIERKINDRPITRQMRYPMCHAAPQ